MRASLPADRRPLPRGGQLCAAARCRDGNTLIIRCGYGFALGEQVVQVLVEIVIGERLFDEQIGQRPCFEMLHPMQHTRYMRRVIGLRMEGGEQFFADLLLVIEEPA